MMGTDYSRGESIEVRTGDEPWQKAMYVGRDPDFAAQIVVSQHVENMNGKTRVLRSFPIHNVRPVPGSGQRLARGTTDGRLWLNIYENRTVVVHSDRTEAFGAEPDYRIEITSEMVEAGRIQRKRRIRR